MKPNKSILPVANEFTKMAVYYGIVDFKPVRLIVSFDGTYGRTEVSLYKTPKALYETGEHYYTRTYRGFGSVPDKYHALAVEMYRSLKGQRNGEVKIYQQK